MSTADEPLGPADGAPAEALVAELALGSLACSSVKKSRHTRLGAKERPRAAPASWAPFRRVPLLRVLPPTLLPPTPTGVCSLPGRNSIEQLSECTSCATRSCFFLFFPLFFVFFSSLLRVSPMCNHYNLFFITYRTNSPQKCH